MSRRCSTRRSAPHRSAVLALATTFLIAFSIARADSPEQAPARPGSDRPAHLEARGDEAADLDDALERAFVSPRAVITFGEFTSVQVNTNAMGMNVVGDAANEPSIAVDPTDPNNIVIAWRQFDTILSNFRQAGMANSNDAGTTWNARTLDPGIFRSDPVLDVDADGVFYFNSLTTPGSTFQTDYFVSTDGGQSWAGPIFAFGGDKQWQTIDRTSGIGRGNAYAYWSVFGNPSFPAQFSRSTDGAQTWENPLAYTSLRRHIWGTLSVGPDGELYTAGIGVLLNTADTTRIVVNKSLNAEDPNQTPTFLALADPDLAGLRLRTGGAPNPGGLLGQVWIATSHAAGPRRGEVYVLALLDPAGDDSADVALWRSDDGAASWAGPIRVNDDAPAAHAWQWFGALGVSPSGRLDAVWADTRNDPTVTLSEYYYAFSIDGGTSWSPSVPLTPSYNHFLGYPNQNKIGDYIQLISDGPGAHLAYSATFNGEQDVYYLRIAIDCDGNGRHDAEDIATGVHLDLDLDGVPDVCQGVFGDFDHDGDVDTGDFGVFAQCFGGALNPPAVGCPPDVDADPDGDGDVDTDDFAHFAQNFTGSQ